MKKSKKSVMGRVENIGTEEVRMPEDLTGHEDEGNDKSPIRNAKRKKAEEQAQAQEKAKQGESEEKADAQPRRAEPREHREFPKQLVLYILAVLTILVFVVLKLYDSVGWQQDMPTYILAFVLIAIGCSISPVSGYIINKRARARVIRANTYYLDVTFTNNKQAKSQLIKALVSSSQGNAEKTEGMLEKLLDKCSAPQEFASIYTIMGGNAAKNGGDAQKAIEYYEKALAQQAGFAGAWYGLAVAHMRLDDLRPAQEELARARELGYDRSKVRRALEVIDEMLEDDSRVFGDGSGYSTAAMLAAQADEAQAAAATSAFATEEFVPQTDMGDPAHIAGEIAPFTTFERDGKFFASLNADGKYKAEIFAAREAEGFIGSGYDWEKLAKALISEELQEYDGVIDFDSRADMFSAFSASKGALQHFVVAFSQVCGDDARMAELLSRVAPD